MEGNSPEDLKDCGKYVYNEGGAQVTSFQVVFNFLFSVQSLTSWNQACWYTVCFPCLLFTDWWEAVLPHPGVGDREPVLWSLQRDSFRKQSKPGALLINCWTDVTQSNPMFYCLGYVLMKEKPTTPKYLHWCLLLSNAKYSINYDTACILDNINASLQKMWQRNPQLLLR